jgi:predicted PurR-regulated permease PerM
MVGVLGVQIYGLIYQMFNNTDELANLTQKVTGAHDSIWTWLESKDLIFSTEWQQQLDKIVGNTLVSVKSGLLAQAQNFFASTPEVLLNIFIFTLAFAAFILMGGKVFMSVTSVFGIEGDHANQFQRFEKVCFVSLGSVILIGLMQASLVTIGARICGVGSYFIVFALTFIFSMIPLLGAGLVPVGFLIFNVVQGDTFSAVVMGITALITGVADNVLKAWLFSKAAKTNPIISMISLIGGITLMGFAGLFIAPTIEQLVMAEYHRRRELTAQKGQLT